RCQDVSLIKQIEHADDQADDAKPARQHPTAENDDAEGDGPADPQQLSEVFPEKSPTVLVLGEPCSCQRCSTCSIALLIHLCQGWDHEHPAQEANQGKYDRDG